MLRSRAGFNALKYSYLVLLAGVAVAAFLAIGSYFYWGLEKKNTQQSELSMRDIRGRLDSARRDLNDLRGSEATYKAVVGRGVLVPEERLDLIEALAALKRRHQLDALSYEVLPQRPLRMSSGAAYSGIDVMASRIKLTIRTAHEGHLVAFLDEFPRMQRGFFPLDRCVVKRAADAQVSPNSPEVKSDLNSLLGAVNRIATAQAASSAAKLQQDDDGETSNSSAAKLAAAKAVVAGPKAELEAECSLEWITLQAKGNGGAAPVAVSPSPASRPK